jgi:hypothetical protein
MDFGGQKGNIRTMPNHRHARPTTSGSALIWGIAIAILVGVVNIVLLLILLKDKTGGPPAYAPTLPPAYAPVPAYAPAPAPAPVSGPLVIVADGPIWADTADAYRNAIAEVIRLRLGMRFGPYWIAVAAIREWPRIYPDPLDPGRNVWLWPRARVTVVVIGNGMAVLPFVADDIRNAVLAFMRDRVADPAHNLTVEIVTLTDPSRFAVAQRDPRSAERAECEMRYGQPTPEDRGENPAGTSPVVIPLVVPIMGGGGGHPRGGGRPAGGGGGAAPCP